MHNWHSTHCRKPDVHVVDGVPCCSYCDSIPDLASCLEGFQAPNPEEFSINPSSLNLRWPSSVNYTKYPQAELRGDITSNTSIDQAVPCKKARHAYNQGQHENQPHAYCRFSSKYELRLLSLSKAPLEAPLHGQLDLNDLLDAPAFEALSYTWGGEDGNTEKSKLIYIGSMWLALTITVNCDAALRWLRAQRDLVIWVDAICINQNDVQERSHQVSIMREIYSKAQRVIMYLGSSSETSHQAMQALIDSRELQPDGVITDPTIATLFARRYFSRVWVIQEVAMAQRIVMICGNDELDRRWFNTLPLSFQLSRQMPQWLLKYAQMGVKRFSGSSDFAQLLDYTSVCSATDPRDQVFAIMGLVANAQAEGLVPDYSLTLQQVFTGVASYLVLKHRYIELLAYPKTNDPAFPSWVPDWSVPRTKEFEPFRQEGKDSYVSKRKRTRLVKETRINLLNSQETISTVGVLSKPDHASHSSRQPVQTALDENEKHITWLNGKKSIRIVYELSKTGYPQGFRRLCYRSAWYSYSQLCGLPRVEFDTGVLHLLAWRIIDLQSGYTHIHSTTYIRDMSWTAGAREIYWILRTEHPLKPEVDLVAFVPGCRSYLHLRKPIDKGQYTLLGVCDVGLRSAILNEDRQESDADWDAVVPESDNNRQGFEAKDLDCKMMGIYWEVSDVLLEFMGDWLNSPIGKFLRSDKDEAEDAHIDAIQDADRIERLSMIGMLGVMWNSNGGWQAHNLEGQGIKPVMRDSRALKDCLIFGLTQKLGG